MSAHHDVVIELDPEAPEGLPLRAFEVLARARWVVAVAEGASVDSAAFEVVESMLSDDCAVVREASSVPADAAAVFVVGPGAASRAGRGRPFESIVSSSRASVWCAAAGVTLDDRTRLARSEDASSAPEGAGTWIRRDDRGQLVADDGPLGTLFERRRLRTDEASAGIVVTGPGTLGRAARACGLDRPLLGVRVLVTRARAQARETAALLRARGAIARVLPTIRLAPPTDPAPLARAVAALDRYDWVVFTSANGVDAWFANLRAQGLDARALGGRRLAAIGPGTGAALEAHGLHADLVAREHRGEGLATALLEHIELAARARTRVLLPRAEVARDALPEMLAAAGVTVDVTPAYRTDPVDPSAADALRAAIAGRRVDAVLFTASSTVAQFCALFDDPPAATRDLRLASIGPITSETMRARGLRVDVEASPYTMTALIDALEASYRRSEDERG
jgi:uroporphyrinogen-III synthase